MIPSKGWPSVYQNTAVRIINESNMVYAIDPIIVSLIVLITTSIIAGAPVTTTESTFPSSSSLSRGCVSFSNSLTTSLKYAFLDLVLTKI